jgi:hypothetical protein
LVGKENILIHHKNPFNFLRSQNMVYLGRKRKFENSLIREGISMAISIHKPAFSPNSFLKEINIKFTQKSVKNKSQNVAFLKTVFHPFFGHR